MYGEFMITLEIDRDTSEVVDFCVLSEYRRNLLEKTLKKTLIGHPLEDAIGKTLQATSKTCYSGTRKPLYSALYAVNKKFLEITNPAGEQIEKEIPA